MAKIKVLAGDFLQGDGEYFSGNIRIETPLHPWPGIRISGEALQSVEVASQVSSKRVDDAIGLGLAGALMLGPVGAAAGLMLAGQDTEVTFWATLKDGKKFLAATDDQTYRNIANHVAKPEFVTRH
ncbi:hypothetical protein [Pseudomonas sp. DWP3-1-2]|uniref:hypothetical protein n=1 Tax=Pseudomonas sp. DWP3-1-2 TaxID=2804645 RepID=UPI003CF67EDC